MTNIIARLKVNNKNFEILVDCDKALEFKKTQDMNAISNILVTDEVFSDNKKGLRASNSDIKDAFGTESITEVASKIIKQGDLQLPQEYRDKMRAEKFKQVVNFLATNGMDPRTKMPYTPTIIETAMKEAGIKIDEKKKAADQAIEIIKQLETKLPIKISVKKIAVTIPAEHVGKMYMIFGSIKREKEEWKNDGSCKCIIDLPAGMQTEFYDKLNNLTKGSAITEEVAE